MPSWTTSNLNYSVRFIHLSHKYSILNSFSGDAHQKFATKDNVPLIGGIFILLGLYWNPQKNPEGVQGGWQAPSAKQLKNASAQPFILRLQNVQNFH